MIDLDLQEKSIELWREDAWELHGKLRAAENRIEQLEAALREAKVLCLKTWKANGERNDDQLGVVALILATALGEIKKCAALEGKKDGQKI